MKESEFDKIKVKFLLGLIKIPEEPTGTFFGECRELTNTYYERIQRQRGFEFLECGFCGKEIKVGDKYKYTYTNYHGSPVDGTTPLTCESCAKMSYKQRILFLVFLKNQKFLFDLINPIVSDKNFE